MHDPAQVLEIGGNGLEWQAEREGKEKPGAE
jgi:hypothetical protein